MSILDRDDLGNIDAPVILFSSVSTWTPSQNDTKSKGMAAPQPPPRTQSCVRPSVAPPPPPPPPSSSIPPIPPTRNSSISTNFASKYRALFESISNIPGPEPFTNCQKLYPSQQQGNRVQRSRRSRPAPKPPTNNEDTQSCCKDNDTKTTSLNKHDSRLIDISESGRNLTSFVDESLSKLSSALTLESQPLDIADPTNVGSSNLCIDCPTCNQLGHSLITENQHCQQFSVPCLQSNGLDQANNESYQPSIHQESSTNTVVALDQHSTANYLANGNNSTNNIVNPPYNYQYHATRAPYSYSATSSYLQSISNQSLFIGQTNYQQQPPVNYNEYFWGPN